MGSPKCKFMAYVQSMELIDTLQSQGNTNSGLMNIELVSAIYNIIKSK